MTTTIRIKRKTKKELENVGQKGQTFDDIIVNLLEFYHSNK